MKALTIVLGILVLVTVWHAWFARPGAVSTPLAKQNQPLGKVVDPGDIASLTIANWDDQLAQAKVFAVKRQGGKWIIPSHFDYPADGGTRVGRTAGLLNTPRGRFVTDDPKRFEELGVIDPTSEQAAAAKERGKRITLKDEGGAVLLDLIVGKQDSDGGTGAYFVREDGSSEVYTAKIDADISTRFIDWVEADLLKLQRDDLRSIAIRDYSVDETAMKIDVRAETALTRPSTEADWTSPQAPADKRVAKSGVDALLTELTGMRLAGIRPFEPEWLTQRGFYLVQNPELAARKGAVVVPLQGGRRAVLIGNEGEVTVGSKNGLQYHLFFGEIALGDEEDKDAAAKKPEAKDKEAKPEAKAGNNRYMVVWTTYDPAFDEELKAEEAKQAEAAKKAEEKKDGEEPKKEEPKRDIAAERKKAVEKALGRFNAFFYVISDSTFQNLRPNADKLFEAKPAEPMAGTTGKTNKQWLEENGKKPGVTTTASGLQYEVIARGADGGKQPTDADQVRVKYKGTLVDGTEFDSSKDGTADFGVTGVIKGWTEALKLMKPGDTWRLFIPPEIGYGEAGSPPKIPANSILIFEVELVAVNP